MVGTKALYAQVAIVLFLLAVAPYSANSKIYTYACTERVLAVPNIYFCNDGEHVIWERYEPYNWSVDPAYLGEVYEIFLTPGSIFQCAPVRPRTNSRRSVRGRVRLHHPYGLPSNPLTASHSANVECWSPRPPPPPPPPIQAFNTNLEFILCMTAVRPGAPQVIAGPNILVGEAGDSCALNPDDGVDEIITPPNNH